ncbi:MAG TPA: phage holin family protein [Opitutaceae bacterium]|nr:phage holin family protein [Opitutaceae bacterium]
MNRGFVNLLVRWVVLALGVVISAKVVPGISYDSGLTLFVVVMLLSLANAVLKPLLVLFTLPFVILTLGIGIWLINALLFLFVGKLVDGFQVSGFGAALLGALIVSVTNIVMSSLLGDRKQPGKNEGARRTKRDDVIDV